MDRIPLELQEKIFAHSCVDGGYTGCALSLVSKEVRDASQQYRYFSVSLRGLRSALEFAKLLGKQPINNIRVYHLYVTNQYPYASFDSYSPIANKTNVIPIFLRKIFQKISKRKISEKGIVQTAAALEDNPHLSDEENMHATMFTILFAITSTLKTLSIDVDFDFHDPAIPSLPCLTELTLKYSFGWRTHPITRVLGTLKQLSSLQTLDLLGLTCYAKPEEIMTEVAKVAPNITHICLPIIRGTHFRDIGLGPDSTFWERPNGEDLMIQMQLDPWLEGVDNLASRSHWSGIWNFLTYEAGRRPKFVFLTREKPIDVCFEEQQDNWKSRITGGTGRWVSRE